MKTAHACELRDSYNIISWHNSMTKQQLASSEQLIDKHTSLFLDRMKGCVYQTVEEQVNMSRVLINELFRRRQLLHAWSVILALAKLAVVRQQGVGPRRPCKECIIYIIYREAEKLGGH